MSDEHLTGQLAGFRVLGSGPRDIVQYFEEDLDRTKLDNNDFKLAIYENQHQFRTKNWADLKERLLDREKIIKYFETPVEDRKVSEETLLHTKINKFKS